MPVYDLSEVCRHCGSSFGQHSAVGDHCPKDRAGKNPFNYNKRFSPRRKIPEFERLKFLIDYVARSGLSVEQNSYNGRQGTSVLTAMKEACNMLELKVSRAVGALADLEVSDVKEFEELRKSLEIVTEEKKKSPRKTK